MSRYRKISPSIWNDEKFRSLTAKGKLVVFMLLSHPLTSAIGTLRAYPQGLAPDLGWPEEEFREAFSEVVQLGIAICAEKDGLIWLPNFTKYNMPENPNVLKSWAGALDDCPECSLKTQVSTHIKTLAETLGEGFAKGFREAFKIGKADGMPNQEHELVQEQQKRVGNPAPPNCPHQAIVDLYHEELPTLPRVKVWDEIRQSYLKARWRERWAQGKYATVEKGIEYWRRFFQHIRECPFLMGEIKGHDGRPPFLADLSWLVKPENFAKVIEGKYDKRP